MAFTVTKVRKKKIKVLYFINMAKHSLQQQGTRALKIKYSSKPDGLYPHPHHLFVVVKDAGTETGFLCFPRCNPRESYSKRQCHCDTPTSRFTTAVISTHQKQPVEDRAVSIFPGSGLPYLERVLCSVGIIFTPKI